MRREILTDYERVLLAEYLENPEKEKSLALSVLLHRVKRYWGSIQNDMQLIEKAFRLELQGDAMTASSHSRQRGSGC